MCRKQLISWRIKLHFFIKSQPQSTYMKIIQPFAILGLSIITFVACKPKETDLLTVKDGLIGSWKLQQQGSDLNKNRKFDTDEKNAVADSSKFTFQLIKDGSGYKIGANSSYVDTMKWVLFNDESTLHFQLYDKGFVNNQYYTFEYGSKTLILVDTTVSPVYFRFFERQN